MEAREPAHRNHVGKAAVHIGLVGRVDADTFLENIGDCLIRMGHVVTRLGSAQIDGRVRLAGRAGTLALRTLPTVEDRLHRRLVRRAFARECDVVITTDGMLAPRAVAALRRGGVGVGLWFPDAVSNLGSMRMLSAPYTAMFFKDPLLVERLRAVLGLPAWYLPEACNPRWHRPIGEGAVSGRIVVVGNTYVSRLLLLRRLHEAGIPLAVFGGRTSTWARDLLPPGVRVGPPAFREDKSRLFRAAAGVLNNLHPAEMHGVNCRLFEATGAGAAVLCERRPALADLYDTDREVVAFSDFAGLVDAAGALVSDPLLGRRIGDAAAKRAHADHTYDVRLPIILEKLV